MRSSIKVVMLLLIFNSGAVFSQVLKTELQKVRDAYLQSTDMSFDVEVLGYKTKKDVKGFKIGKGNVVKSKDAYYSFYSGSEYLKTKESVIIIDHEEKEINVFENAVSNKKADKNNPVVLVDSVIKMADSVRYEGEINGNKKFSIYDANSPIVKTEIYSNPLTNYINKIVYYYASSDAENDYSVHRVVIAYKNIKNQISNPNVLLESRVLNRKKKSIGLTDAYKGYKLIQNQNIDL